MSTAYKVLHLLEHNRDKHLSGQQLSASLGMTRAAIWKAVEQLRDDGHVIEGVSNRGYRLLSCPGLFDKQVLQEMMPDHEIHLFDSLDSTNRFAKTLVSEGRLEKTLVLSTYQSGGRGRLGRRFESPKGGIYLTLLINPDCQLEDALLITSASAVATARAIEQVCHLSCSIKWVNDLFLDGKKVCGILTEGVLGVESGKISTLVIGIGINFCTDRKAFSTDLGSIATSLYDGSDSIPEDVDAHELVTTVVLELERLASLLPDRSFLDEYRARSMVLGREVSVHSGRYNYSAMVEAIDDNAHLVVVDKQGNTKVLSSGEISIRLEV